MTEPLLELTGLCKRFGALTATDNVSLRVNPGEIHALIGPNGAGKTTLVNQIAGELLPDSGGIWFNGKDITALPVHERARSGISRTFQVTNLFSNLTVKQNLALAVQPSLGHSFRFWQRAESLPGLTHAVNECLTITGLEDRSNAMAGSLSHGEKRQVAIAMALAARPTFILMDEPAAGMGKHESDLMGQLLTSMKAGKGILLVEHDMDLVFSVADRISVLVYGRIIATGTPAEIRNNSQVNKAYLGEDHA